MKCLERGGGGTSQVVYADYAGRSGNNMIEAVMAYARVGYVSQIGRNGGRIRSGVVRVKDLDGFIARHGDELLVFCPAHPLHNVLMCFTVPDFFSARQVPHLDNTYTASSNQYQSLVISILQQALTIPTSTGKVVQRFRIFGHGVDAINMTPSQLCNKRGGEHAFKLDGIESSSVFSCTFKRVESRVEVSRLLSYT